MKWLWIVTAMVLLLGGCFPDRGGHSESIPAVGTVHVRAALHILVDASLDFSAAAVHLRAEHLENGTEKRREAQGLPAFFDLNNLPVGQWQFRIDVEGAPVDLRSQYQDVTILGNDPQYLLFRLEETSDALSGSSVYGTVSIALGEETTAHNAPAPQGLAVPAAADPDLIVVELAPGRSGQWLTERGYEIIDALPVLNRFLIRTPPAQQITLQSHGEVLSTEALISYSSQEILEPNDTYYSSEQWNLRAVQMPLVWPTVTGASSIRIAVLDTAVDDSHPDLQGRLDLIDARNFTSDGGEPPTNSHGTHVAGIIGAAANNSQGIAGIDWEAEMVPVGVLDDGGYGTNWNLAKGLLYAAGLLENEDTMPISRPVDVINISLGGSQSSVVSDAAAKVLEEGILIAAAAGNLGQEGLLYPAAEAGVLAVGSAGPDGRKRSYFSNYGAELDLLAPGEQILSTIVDGGGSFFSGPLYGFMSGTSMAAPHVSAAAALLLSAGIAPQDAAAALKNSARPAGSQGGAGFLQVASALGIAGTLEYPETDVPLPDTITIQLYSIGPGTGDFYDTTAALEDGEYSFRPLPADEYRMTAWIDRTESGVLDPDDYWFETTFVLEENTTRQQAVMLERYSPF